MIVKLCEAQQIVDMFSLVEMHVPEAPEYLFFFVNLMLICLSGCLSVSSL